MRNTKDIMRKKTPSSLVHYTSQQTLYNIFENLDEKDGEVYFKLHASNINMMNDMDEQGFFLSKFFTKSLIKKDLQSLLDNIIAQNGDLFVISFMKSDLCKFGKIPMWKMYADNGNGVMLKFRYKELYNFLNQQIFECKYINTTSIQEIIKAKNKELKNGKTERTKFVQCLYKEVALYKYNYWEYENEYRFIIQSNKPLFKHNSLGLVSYTEVRIPLSCISEILIGPIANQIILDRSLNQLKTVLLKKYGKENINFNIKKSKLKLQSL